MLESCRSDKTFAIRDPLAPRNKNKNQKITPDPTEMSSHHNHLSRNGDGVGLMMIVIGVASPGGSSPPFWSGTYADAPDLQIQRYKVQSSIQATKQQKWEAAFSGTWHVRYVQNDWGKRSGIHEWMYSGQQRNMNECSEAVSVEAWGVKFAQESKSYRISRFACANFWLKSYGKCQKPSGCPKVDKPLMLVFAEFS